MNWKKTLLCLSAITTLGALTACDSGDGYYDSRGNWHWSGARDQNTAYDMKADPNINPSGDDNYYVDHSAVRGDPMKVSGYRSDRDPEVTPAPYHRRGYYDQNGNYISYNNSPHIPRSYFPPKNMCRVWFTDRALADEPPVESCAGIQDRVPDGAYVVYGG